MCAGTTLQASELTVLDLGSGYDIDANVSNISRLSWTKTPKLSSSYVKALCDYAQHAPGRRPSYSKDEVIYFSDVENGRLVSGEKVLMLRIDPIKCHEIDQLCRDPVLLALAEGYLGYKPRAVEGQLLWSFAGVDADMSERHRKAQAVYYHWDSMAFNGFRVTFYLTDVDEHSGAHVLIPGSHRRRPLRYMWARSTTSDDSKLLEFYGDEEVVKGTCGTGFAQDINGFHKALPPKNANRLTLNFRYE